MTSLVALLTLTLAGPVQASKPSDAAKSFTLDLGALPSDDRVTTPATPASADPGDEKVVVPADPVAPPITPKAKVEPLVPATFALFTLDTPIAQLVADPRARGVLDKVLPGLSTDENLPKFRALSLRQFQPLTGGQLTDDLLKQAETELAAIKPLATKKRRLDSR